MFCAWTSLTWASPSVTQIAEATKEFLQRGSQVFAGELRGDASEGSQNPRIRQQNDGVHRASYEEAACTVKFVDRREGQRAALVRSVVRQEDDDRILGQTD